MKIVNLQIENIKKIKAVEITPDGNMVVIAGENEQGKTTILDSIWWAIGGTKNIQEEPLRTGTTKGHIKIDLGDMVATRKFTKSGSTIEVVNKQGLKFPSPQSVLDKLVSRFSFDIQEFAKADKKVQVDTLLGTVEIPIDPEKLQQLAGVAIDTSLNPLDMLNKAYKAVYDERTVVNRDLDKAKKAVDSMPEVAATEPVSITELVAEKEELEKHNRENAQKVEARGGLVLKLTTNNNSLEATRQQIADLKEKLKKAEKEFEQQEIDRDEAQQALEDYDKELAQLKDNDLTGINSRITNADETNRTAQSYKERQAAIKTRDDYQSQSDAYSTKLENIKTYKEELMKQVKFPIEGLDFAGGGVTYQGLPFEQASEAQKLQVSCAIAMALNPDLRVLRLSNGSLLDSKHMAIIEQMAKDNDYQVWLEKVDESGKVGIVIEDGEVKKEA